MLDLGKGFLTKSISKPYGRATAMTTAWELKVLIFHFHFFYFEQLQVRYFGPKFNSSDLSDHNVPNSIHKIIENLFFLRKDLSLSQLIKIGIIFGSKKSILVSEILS